MCFVDAAVVDSEQHPLCMKLQNTRLLMFYEFPCICVISVANGHVNICWEDEILNVAGVEQSGRYKCHAAVWHDLER